MPNPHNSIFIIKSIEGKIFITKALDVQATCVEVARYSEKNAVKQCYNGLLYLVTHQKFVTLSIKLSICSKGVPCLKGRS